MIGGNRDMRMGLIFNATWNRVAVAIISRICPINNAKMNTPVSQATVMNSNSPSLSGFGFLPIDVAVFVANAKHRTYGCPLPLNTHRSLPRPVFMKPK